VVGLVLLTRIDWTARHQRHQAWKAAGLKGGMLTQLLRTDDLRAPLRCVVRWRWRLCGLSLHTALSKHHRISSGAPIDLRPSARSKVLEPHSRHESGGAGADTISVGADDHFGGHDNADTSPAKTTGGC
jgi:hypothetical protein